VDQVDSLDWVVENMFVQLPQASLAPFLNVETLETESMRRVLIHLTLLAVFAWYHNAHAAQLSLSWADNSKDEVGFRIERKKGTQGKYEEIAIVAPNVTSYTDINAQAGTKYCYRVRSFNSVGSSTYSQETCGTAALEEASKSKAIIGIYDVHRATPLYSQPSEDSQQAATIPAGMKVQVVDILGDWLEIQSKYGRGSGFIRKDSTVPNETPRGVAIIKHSSPGFLGLFSRRPNTLILSVDGKKVAQSDLVKVSAGPHVIGIECTGSPRPFSSRSIKETIDYDLQAKDGHTYEINAELVGGMCKLWIDDTTKN